MLNYTKKLGKIIAFTGTHGTGKTTATFEKAVQLKKENPKKSVAVIAEIASRCPFPINKKTTQEAQLWIFTRQLTVELEAVQKNDIVVSDRPIFDAIAYTRVAGFWGLAGAMLEMSKEHIERYQEIYFRACRENQFCFADGIRDSSDAEFRMSIEKNLIEIYQILGFEVKNDGPILQQ